MQTPAHVAVSLFVWRKLPNVKSVVAVVVGALLPDITMFFFYGYQKVVGSSESDIWTTLYFLDHWQWFFDIFNSIPVYALIALVCYKRDHQIGFLVSASALIHVLCDFPLHNDDAHRHFLPLTNWRFESPVSYWDPKHFGIYVAICELLMAVSFCTALTFKRYSKPIRVSAWIVFSIYILVLILALVIFLRFNWSAAG
jgi:hypothetical protein